MKNANVLCKYHYMIFFLHVWLYTSQLKLAVSSQVQPIPPLFAPLPLFFSVSVYLPYHVLTLNRVPCIFKTPPNLANDNTDSLAIAYLALANNVIYIYERNDRGSTDCIASIGMGIVTASQAYVCILCMRAHMYGYKCLPCLGRSLVTPSRTSAQITEPCTRIISFH